MLCARASAPADIREPMGNPDGFDWTLVRGEVRITHRGRHASTLRGAAVERFLAQIEQGDPQDVMARATGNYKRGNERTAKEHPRNRGR